MNDAKPVKKIGLVYNLKETHAAGDRYEEYDEPATVEALKQEIESRGFTVVLYPQDETFLVRIAEDRPDFVVNIAEGIGTSRARESQIPCILESLDIPYSGSDPLSLGITLDKYLTWEKLKAAHVQVPELHMVKKAKDAELLKGVFKNRQPFIVKPRWEGSSKGIYLNSIATDVKQASERVEYILSTYHQPAIIEEFLERDEITVGVCGNDSPWVLGMMKIVPRNPQEGPFIYSIETKRNWQEKVIYEPQEKILPAIQSQVQYYALKAFSALELRDVARIDFRVDRNNIPRVIDINPLPGLSPHYSDLPILWKLRGGRYSDLIRVILQESFKRCGLRWK